MTPDLTYTTSGLFTRFYPETEAGETAWREMHEHDATAVLSPHAPALILQLRRAGYTVAKAKPSKQSIESILAELEA